MSTTLKLVRWAERTVTLLIAEGLEFYSFISIECQLKIAYRACNSVTVTSFAEQDWFLFGDVSFSGGLLPMKKPGCLG